MLGPSLGALSGSSCTSMNSPSTPQATAARARNGTLVRSPPVEVPAPPGRWTEWVASKISGWKALAESQRIEDEVDLEGLDADELERLRALGYVN